MARLYDTGIFSVNSSSGAIGVGYKLYFYTTGTSTPKNTYPTRADAVAGTNPNPNPMVAAADGRWSPIWLTPGDYKVILKDFDDVTLETRDPAESNNDEAQTLANFAASGGSALVGFIQSGTGAAATTVQAELRQTVTAKQFGALGNSTGASGNGADDTAAIQAALDYLGNNGGGTVLLPKTTGNYRITSVLKIPSYVTLEGCQTSSYPFNAGNTNASALVADFSSANQWIVEAKTTSGGSPIGYNTMLTALPDGATYNCSVKNLVITAVGSNMPFGGIRMHGCPGSVVENVAVNNTGCGLLVNFSFGGHYKIQCLTSYYGIVAWDDANANIFEGYCAQQSPFPTTVPAGYLMPFMSSLSTILTTTYNLSTNAHYNRPFGVIIGSLASTSVNNRMNVVVERFGGGIFQLFSLATSFGRCYLEGSAGQMDYALVAAQSTFSTASLHAFMSGTGDLLDIGASTSVDIRANGTMGAATFGTVYANIATRVIVRGITLAAFGPATPQFNIEYETTGSWIAPTLVNSWANIVGDVDAGYRRENGRVYLNGAVNGGSASTTITTLPAGYRPFNTIRDPSGGSKFTISSAGVVTAQAVGPISFTGFSFEQTG